VPASPAESVEGHSAVPVSASSALPVAETGGASVGAGAALATKSTLSLLDRSLNGPRYPQPEVQVPGTAALVLRWLSGATHLAHVALPLAAAFLFAVAIHASLPWLTRELAPDSVPALSESDDRDDDRPAAAPTRPPTTAGTGNDSQAAGVISDSDAPTPTCAVGSISHDLAAEIEEHQQAVAALDRQISVIVAQFPGGNYPSEVRLQLTNLQRARDGQAETLDELMAQAASGGC
jgi:hypothetical protein